VNRESMPKKAEIIQESSKKENKVDVFDKSLLEIFNNEGKAKEFIEGLMVK